MEGDRLRCCAGPQKGGRGEEKKGDRWLRLGDLAPHEVIVVRCPCGRSVEYHKIINVNLSNTGY